MKKKKKSDVIEVKMGRRRGAPNRYTPNELTIKSREYFDICDATVLWTNDKTGVVIRKPKTLGGFCAFIGVSTDYIGYNATLPDYKEVIASIRQECENSIEIGILVGGFNTQAGIFSLKNRHPDNWKDKVETENKTDTTITFKIED